MLGIFIARGMTLRIPAGGLRITLDGEDGPSFDPVKFEVSLDVWEHWFEIGSEAVAKQSAARAQLRTAHSGGDDKAKGVALEDELQGGMIAASAAAFALDSFYASVKARLTNGAPEAEDTATPGTKRRASRPA